ncbi:MAG: succinate dehydrogenase assembly factor 2 [Hyphomicrobiaceae bacterium]|jgi:antitoxin CptB
MTLPTDDIEVRRRRAAYRAGHRGTKEMDWLLGRYADAVLPALPVAELAAFEELLALPDPELHAWIIDPAPIAGRAIAELIGRIRAFHGLDAEAGAESRS